MGRVLLKDLLLLLGMVPVVPAVVPGMRSLPARSLSLAAPAHSCSSSSTAASCEDIA